MTVTIGRRELLAALGGAAAAWPLAAPGQPTVPVIGFFNGASQNGYAPIETAFLQGLKDAIDSICDRRCGWGPRQRRCKIGGAFDRPHNNQNTLGGGPS